MSKGTIQDCRVKIKPSKKLIKFISELHTHDALPENIAKIYKIYNESTKRVIDLEYIPKESFTKNEKDILKELVLHKEHTNVNKTCSINEDDEDVNNKSNENAGKTDDNKIKLESSKIDPRLNDLYLHLNDVKWLNEILKKKRAKKETNLYLYELIENSDLILPENEIIARNPELESRCKKLKQEQEAREYRKMTKDVDTSRKYTPEDTVSFQLKAINKQLIAVLQFIFSVVAGFAFGFIGVELIIGNLDFGFRLLLGIMCALVIALAEIYFLAKKLNEYDEIPDLKPQTSGNKVHQD